MPTSQAKEYPMTNTPAIEVAAWQQRPRQIAQLDEFAQHLNTQAISIAEDSVQVLMPYRAALGVGRVHGGAISGLIDIAATAAFWATPLVTDQARGATVGFTVNFLGLAVAADLIAHASVRRRGGTLCTGDVSVRDPDNLEVATAIVTYKMNR